MPKTKQFLTLKPVFLKSSIFIVAFLGLCLFFSGGKVAADDDPGDPYWRCPGSITDVPNNWGIQDRALQHGYASLTVYAQVYGDPYHKLNVTYRLNSDVTRGYNYGPPPDGLQNKSLYPSARIFTYAGTGEDGQVDVNGRINQHQFRTGGQLNAPGGHCDGWDELGPGNGSYIGNGFVLDCEEIDVNHNVHNNHFWIDQISTPNGSAGKYGGYWTVQIASGGTYTRDVPFPMNYDSNPDKNRSSDLQVTNGDNARVNLFWHPNPPPPPSGASNPRCSQLDVQGGGYYTTPNGKTWETRTYVRVTDSGGHVLVHGDGDNPFSEIGTNPGDSKTWNYRAKGLQITTQVIRKYKHLDGDDWVWTEYQNNSNNYTCYDASCDLSVQGNVAGRGNGIQSRSAFDITAHIHNNGNPPESTQLWGAIDGRPLILSSTSSPVGFWYAPGQVEKGANDYNTWTVGEPGWNIGNYGVNATLYYDLDPTPGIQSGDLVLANCSGTNYDVYKQFSLGLSSSVDPSPSLEDPNRITYTGRADATGPYGIPGELGGSIAVNWSANAKRKLYGGPDQTINSQAGYNNTPVLYQWGFDPRPNHAGDKYYMNYGDFCVGQVAGWIGPSNQFSADTYGGCAAGDDRIVRDEPYMNVYGSDTITGSNFKTGETCDTTGSTSQTIKAYRSLEPAKGGSGTQFAVLALNQISGFASASMNGAGPVGLTFANTVGVGGGVYDRPGDGGGYQGQAVCAQDFYSTRDSDISKDLSVGSTSPADLTARVNSQNGGKPTQFYRNGSLTINAGNFTKQATVFVNGDVVINGNISFGTGNYLAIVAKGNIFINRGVTRMDGLYVAQPSDATHGGTIYTCASGTSDIAIGSRYQLCRTQLVVNGAFAAKSVKFHRVLGSLRDSRNRETPTNWNDGTGTHAAEVFNFLPELYLYTPVFEPVTTGGPAQYYTTLPPVL